MAKETVNSLNEIRLKVPDIVQLRSECVSASAATITQLVVNYWTNPQLFWSSIDFVWVIFKKKKSKFSDSNFLICFNLLVSLLLCDSKLNIVWWCHLGLTFFIL